jgi:hypothetical protein
MARLRRYHVDYDYAPEDGGVLVGEVHPHGEWADYDSALAAIRIAFEFAHARGGLPLEDAWAEFMKEEL